MILIVEDDFFIRQSLEDFLSEEGFDVKAAANGAEALSLLGHGFIPHVILLDLMMPVMDGFEFRERQIASPELSTIPVIVMSAYGDSAKNNEKLSVRAYLKKPLNVQEVLDSIFECTHSH